MDLTTVLLIFCAVFVPFLIQFGVLFYVYRRARRFIQDFTESPEAGKPSPLAATVDAISQTFSQRLILQAKTSLMGMASVDSKNEKALQGELALGLAAKDSPLLSVLARSMPTLGRRLVKNPELIELAAGILSKVGPGNNGRAETTTPFKF